MSCAEHALVLYVRADCSLCDLAVGVLAEARVPDFQCVDIEIDSGLVARYANQVPVLHDADSGADLGWPFSAEAVRRFLSQ